MSKPSLIQLILHYLVLFLFSVNFSRNKHTNTNPLHQHFVSPLIDKHYQLKLTGVNNNETKLLKEILNWLLIGHSTGRFEIPTFKDVKDYYVRQNNKVEELEFESKEQENDWKEYLDSIHTQI